ncbi:hypothetical protein V6Z12_D03G175500 [Gossypium hirsutum]
MAVVLDESSFNSAAAALLIQLVILPLSRERGLRCSVKPASRSTLYFRNHEAQSLHSSPLARLLTWNGQARVKPPEIRLSGAKPAFHHLKAPTRVTSSRYRARRLAKWARAIYRISRFQFWSMWYSLSFEDAFTC